MNKSKFLKKSLALLLSVMMVVAMIPLGASAAWTADGTNSIIQITTTGTNVLDKTSTNAGTLTLPYKGFVATDLSVRLQNEVTKLTYKVDDAEAVDLTPVSHAVTIPNTAYTAESKTITLTPYAGETAKTPCVITVKATVASRDTSIKEAVLGTSTSKVTGTVSGTTVTFNVPWGYDDTAANAKDVTLTLNNPTVEDPTVTDTLTKIGTDKLITVTAQYGNSEIYTIVTKTEDPLSTLKVAGVDAKFVEAVMKADGTTVKTPAHYEVVLPTGTKLVDDKSAAIEQPVVFTAKDANPTAKWNASGANTDLKTGGKVALAAVDGDGISKNTLTLTHKDSTKYPAPKTYNVWVSIAKNTVGVMESFKATASNGDSSREFTVDGTVATGKLTVDTLPFTSNLNAVKFAFKASDGATVIVTDSTGADVTSTATTTGIDMIDDNNEPIAYTVEVIPQDATKNSTYYTLTATKVDTRNSSTKVDSMKLTIGTGDEAEDYQASISGTTITFTVPYGTVATDIVNATFTGAYPSGSINTLDKASNTSWNTYTGNDLSATITFTVTAENDDSDTYTIKFTKKAALSGKSLSGVTFANAADADSVKAENTFAGTVSGKTLSATFPYSAQTSGNVTKYAALVPTFTVSEGAKLYKVSGGNLVEVKSGFYSKEDAEADETHAITEGAPKDTVALDAFWDATAGESKETVLYVLDEAAVFEVNANSNNTVAKLQGIGEDEKFYKAHVAEITVDPKFAAPQTGTSITGATDKDGNITGTVSGRKLSISIPGSYADAPFKMTINASAMATVRANDSIDLDDTTEYTVAANGDAYDLKIGSTTVTSLVVENEAGNNTATYTVEVTVRPKETGAQIVSAKVNDVAATIANGKITVSLPATADLGKVTLELKTSPMATAAVTGTPGSEADTYDVSDLETNPLTVAVTSEDGKTTRNYTLVIKTEEISFTDVKPGDWFYDDVIAAATAGIVSGYPDKTYKPNNNIKRKDFAVMVASMMGADLSKYTTSAFSDVAHDYAEKAIAYCGETGIIAGKAPGKFAPNDFITREQAATIVARALKLQSTSANKFADDASISSWASTGVYACVASGIIEGIGNNTFAPKKNLTRAQAARILVLALNQK